MTAPQSCWSPRTRDGGVRGERSPHRTTPPSSMAASIYRSAASGLPDLEPGEPGHRETCLVEDRLDGLLRLLHGRLLDQHDVLEEAVDPTLDDPGQRLLRLALLAGRFLGDTPLVGHGVLG